MEPTINTVKPGNTVPTDTKHIMRPELRVLTENEKKQVKELKARGQHFYDYCGECDPMGTNREASLAKTKIEEAVMWATKAITK